LAGGLPLVAGSSRAAPAPVIEFTHVPSADPGGTERMELIAGRVVGAAPGERIVLYARSGDWWVQPYVDLPFTELGPEAGCRGDPPLGTEYAALLVQPGYAPPARTDTLPRTGGAVVALTVTPGTPPFWLTGWFRALASLGLLAAAVAFYRYRLRQL